MSLYPVVKIPQFCKSFQGLTLIASILKNNNECNNSFNLLVFLVCICIMYTEAYFICCCAYKNVIGLEICYSLLILCMNQYEDSLYVLYLCSLTQEFRNLWENLNVIYHKLCVCILQFAKLVTLISSSMISAIFIWYTPTVFIC